MITADDTAHDLPPQTAQTGGGDADVLATPVDQIPGIVARARTIFETGLLASREDRVDRLHILRQLLVDHEDRFAAALHADLGKSGFEAYISEVGFVINEIDHTVSHLASWMKPEKVRLPLQQRPGKASIRPEPLGVVLVISPWNYPLQLLLAPIVAAIAAGNTVVAKPSEVAPATAKVLTDVVGGALGDVVQFVNGGVDESTALLAEQFDHIFYTGNGTVARIVMAAAAKHLTPVTLELGGKSPAIVTATANVRVAARRIVWGKFLNAGQTCVAPDYVLVERDVADEFIVALTSSIADMFGKDPAASDDYGRIINERHHGRVAGLLDGHGGRVVIGGNVDTADRYIAPTVVVDADDDSELMSDEIFGPILPVKIVESADDAVDFVTARAHPLALYVFSDDDATVDSVISRTTSGGVCVNHVLMHLTVPELPFGGVGESGQGAYHGRVGFDRLSHRKSILQRRSRPDPGLAYPPYSKLVQSMLRRFL